jgi:hypothetical protein
MNQIINCIALIMLYDKPKFNKSNQKTIKIIRTKIINKFNYQIIDMFIFFL